MDCRSASFKFYDGFFRFKALVDAKADVNVKDNEGPSFCMVARLALMVQPQPAAAILHWDSLQAELYCALRSSGSSRRTCASTGA